MGGSSIVCDYGITGEQAQKSVIPGTLTLAQEIGALLSQTRTASTHPIEQMLRLLKGYRGIGFLKEKRLTSKEAFKVALPAGLPSLLEQMIFLNRLAPYISKMSIY